MLEDAAQVYIIVKMLKVNIFILTKQKKGLIYFSYMTHFQQLLFFG